MDKEAHYITPDQLRIGLYVHLDLGWLDHPFMFSNFKIENAAQLAQVRALGLKQIRYDPYRSDPAPEAGTPAPDTAPPPPPDPLPENEPPIENSAPPSAPLDFKQQRLRALHASMHACEQAFSESASIAKRIDREIRTNPPKALQEANTLVAGLVDSLLTEGDIALHAMQQKPGAAEQYVHSLNVTVLALILAKSLDMSSEEAQNLGLGCLFHDIGKSQIPDRVLLKTEPLNKAEQALMQQHVEFGAQFARRNAMPETVIRIIQQHHEYMDGSGFPSGLKQTQIDPLARIVVIVNTFDNLCNPVNPTDAMTPYEALAHMFARMRSKFDADILKLLIKNLGVYPPGSIVQLSDGSYGLVCSVNPSQPLRPYILLYAPEIPREQPLLLNLGEDPALSVSRCLRPAQLPNDVLAYLAPSKRLCYFFQQEHEAANPSGNHQASPENQP